MNLNGGDGGEMGGRVRWILPAGGPFGGLTRLGAKYVTGLTPLQGVLQGPFRSKNHRKSSFLPPPPPPSQTGLPPPKTRFREPDGPKITQPPSPNGLFRAFRSVVEQVIKHLLETSLKPPRTTNWRPFRGLRIQPPIGLFRHSHSVGEPATNHQLGASSGPLHTTTNWPVSAPPAQGGTGRETLIGGLIEASTSTDQKPTTPMCVLKSRISQNHYSKISFEIHDHQQ